MYQADLGVSSGFRRDKNYTYIFDRNISFAYMTPICIICSFVSNTQIGNLCTIRPDES